MESSNLSLGIAFFAGLASFLSPCVFALVPAYIGYLSGRSVATASESKSSSWVTFTHGLAFVIGFTVVFVLLGALLGALGGVLNDVADILVKVGGVVVIIFGLHMTKVIQIPFLNYDLRPQSQPDRQRGYISSALMGVFFSAGWAPCVGPVLGAILTLSFNQGSFTQGAGLLTAYSAGLAIPFLLAATQIGWVTTVIRRYGRVMHYAEIIMGIILIILGVLLLSGQFQLIATAASVEIAFESADAEFAAGQLLLAAAGIIIVVGLIPGFIARARGLNFVDYWFLGMGVTLILMVLLYFFGAFNNVIPLLS